VKFRTLCLALLFVLGPGTVLAALPLARMLGFESLHEGAGPSLVRLYFIPTAPVKLKWGTPRQLLISTVKAGLFNSSHPIGHVAIEVQLKGQDTPETHVFTGATDLHDNAGRHLLLKDEIGFSILERAWPGVLETETNLAKSIRARAPHRDRLAVATFLISDDAAQRLLEYHRALVADPNPRYYGFGARPRRSEGSGCSAFAASFMEQIGLMDPALRAAWSQSVRVPLSLMAGYLGNKTISVARAIASSAAGAWAKPSDPHMFLEFFDPDLMFDWKLHAAPGQHGGLTVQPDPELPKYLDHRYGLAGQAARNVKAIVIDARDVPTPGGPVFIGVPAVAPVPGTTLPTVIRTDKVVSPNGSFEIRP
jgi:hypothetical protein